MSSSFFNMVSISSSFLEGIDFKGPGESVLTLKEDEWGGVEVGVKARPKILGINKRVKTDWSGQAEKINQWMKDEGDALFSLIVSKSSKFSEQLKMARNFEETCKKFNHRYLESLYKHGLRNQKLLDECCAIFEIPHETSYPEIFQMLETSLRNQDRRYINRLLAAVSKHMDTKVVFISDRLVRQQYLVAVLKCETIDKNSPTYFMEENME